MMLNRKSIICFAPSDWWGMNPSCTTHIMKRLAGANTVLYINPFSSDLLGVKKEKRKGFCQRLLRKLKSLTKWLKKPQENLFVFSPLFIPIQGKEFVDAFNNRILLWQIKLACRIAGIKNPLLWIENIRAADLLDQFMDAVKIYHVSDLFCHDGYISNTNVQHLRECRVTEASDLIICVSEELYAIKRQLHKNVHYLPHGVDYELFRNAAQQGVILEEINSVPKPIAGYFGTLTGSNDIDLWEYCAKQLPQVSFVLAGRVTGGDYSKLQEMKNVYMLGHLPYDKIPSLCAAFDVCMLNWKISPWIRSCNPLKTFEYMAAGKPVVAVAIEELKQYKDIISIAADREEFCRLLQWELEHDNELRRQKRSEIARQHDWGRNVSILSNLVTNIIKD